LNFEDAAGFEFVDYVVYRASREAEGRREMILGCVAPTWHDASVAGQLVDHVSKAILMDGDVELLACMMENEGVPRLFTLEARLPLCPSVALLGQALPRVFNVETVHIIIEE
jgi:hypothetical protein